MITVRVADFEKCQIILLGGPGQILSRDKAQWWGSFPRVQIALEPHGKKWGYIWATPRTYNHDIWISGYNVYSGLLINLLARRVCSNTCICMPFGLRAGCFLSQEHLHVQI